MGNIDAGVCLHIDENTTHDERENVRDEILQLDGVMAAAYHDERPHLMLIVYDPALIKSIDFINIAKKHSLHAELIS